MRFDLKTGFSSALFISTVDPKTIYVGYNDISIGGSLTGLVSRVLIIFSAVVLKRKDALRRLKYMSFPRLIEMLAKIFGVHDRTGISDTDAISDEVQTSEGRSAIAS